MNTTIEKQLSTAEEVRQKFGWSEATLYRRISEGKVTPYYLGSSRPYFKLDEIVNSFQPKDKDNEVPK